MIQELIYTSAPQGLRAGSSGFCTVATTHGMAPTLIEQLESLSGYRHVFQPQDPQAKSNPVNYSHLKIAVGGIRYSVLSRVADAGIDYTQRTNKLAHHIVVDAQDIAAAPCGPAALLASPGFTAEQWNGGLRHPLSGRKTVPPDIKPVRCDTWQLLTGHAGWGGILAETVVRGRNRDTCILFQPGMPLLKLVQEAMSLLTPQERWNATFSTYFTKLPPGIDCRWRFLIAGSAEARTAARMPNTLVITLGGNAGAPPANEFSEAAEQGDAPSRLMDSPSATGPVGGTVVSFAQTRGTITPVDDYELQSSIGTPPPSSGTLRATTVVAGTPSSSSHRLIQPSPARRSSWGKPAAAFFSGFIVAGGLLAVALWFWSQSNKRSDSAAKPNDARSENTERTKTRTPPIETDDQGVSFMSAEPDPKPKSRKGDRNQQEHDSMKGEPSDNRKPESEPVQVASVTPKAEPTTSAPIPAPSTPPASPPANDGRNPFEDLEQRHYLLTIPPSSTGALGGAPAADVCNIYLNDASFGGCNLELIGADSLFGPGKVSLDPHVYGPGEPQNEYVRTWDLNVADRLSLKASKKISASLSLYRQDGKLNWKWTNASALSPVEHRSLQFCSLRVTVNGRSEICTFLKPEKTLPLQLTASATAVSDKVRYLVFEKRSTRVDAPVGGSDDRPVPIRLSDPNLKVEFFSPPIQNLVPKALKAPRMGVRYDISRKSKYPCYLDLELVELPVPGSSSYSLTMRASVFFDRRSYIANEKKIKEFPDTEFSVEAIETAYKNLNDSIATLEKFRTEKNNAYQIPAKTKAAEQALTAFNDPKNKKKVGPQAVDAANKALATAQKALDEDADYLAAGDYIKQIKEVVAEYDALVEDIMKFQEQMKFDYRISLAYPGRTIVLYETEGAPKASP